ncbi:MAG: hypothetical protein JO171_15315 [Paludibacterium sp.]|uniref:hypothetical protein n=1 Tax=Paludibacterium sp. TaxID=1917523 RepID=UPI0025D5EC7E|nr:hypothetical protein [Paludibacterium sp.]MBV8048518.1 hypothetical protein [Paludibacterium sp.]MBV8646353.1 hypothetical protein [Paludibacterium sp.]
MDLQWQRQVEVWQRLLAESSQRPARLEPGDRLQLEACRGRALLTLSRPLADNALPPALLRLLRYLQPEATGGLPLRAWRGQGRLWLSVTLPADAPAEDWYAMSLRLRTLVDRASKEAHGSGQ